MRTTESKLACDCCRVTLTDPTPDDTGDWCQLVTVGGAVVLGDYCGDCIARLRPDRADG